MMAGADPTNTPTEIPATAGAEIQPEPPTAVRRALEDAGLNSSAMSWTVTDRVHHVLALPDGKAEVCIATHFQEAVHFVLRYIGEEKFTPDDISTANDWWGEVFRGEQARFGGSAGRLIPTEDGAVLVANMEGAA